MTMLYAALYLALCGYVAGLPRRWVVAAHPNDGAGPLLAFTAFFIVFFAGFHILGLIELLSGKPCVTVLNALAVVGVLAALGFLRTRNTTPALPQAVSAGWMLRERIVQMTLLGFGLVVVLQAFTFPSGFEATSYHLPGALQILQQHTLHAWDINFPHTFPANAGIFEAIALELLPEKWVSITNIIFLLPLFLATAAVSRSTGADRAASVLAACGMLSVPMIAFSSMEQSSDLGGLAFIMSAMYFALCSSLSLRSSLLLAGLSAGLAFGFKSLHLISIAFIGMIALARGYAAGTTLPEKGRQAALAGVLFTAGVFLTAGYWLLRNFMDYGNPLSPVNLPILTDLLHWRRATDVNLLSREATQFEWVRNPGEWLTYPWKESHYLGQNFKGSSGLGAFVAASVPVALFATAIRLAKGYRKGPDRYLLALFLCICFVGAVWWLLGDHQPRYLLSALVYCMPLVAWVLTQAKGKSRRQFNGVLSLCTVAALGIFVSMKVLALSDTLFVSRYVTRAQYYEYPAVIDTLPAGATILNLGNRPWHYPLAGARLSNRVISMQEGRRILGLEPGLGAPAAVTLNAPALHALGVTHIFVDRTVISTNRCIELKEVGMVDKNPTNGQVLAVPRRLLALRYAAHSSGCQQSQVVAFNDQHGATHAR